MKRVTHDRRLTTEEAEKYNDIRKKIEAEKPAINARIRKRMAEKRKREAADSDSQSLGQRIRAAREALGESQVDLAVAAGISQGYLSQLETRNRQPRADAVHRGATCDIPGYLLDELASGGNVAANF